MAEFAAKVANAMVYLVEMRHVLSLSIHVSRAVCCLQVKFADFYREQNFQKEIGIPLISFASGAQFSAAAE